MIMPVKCCLTTLALVLSGGLFADEATEREDLWKKIIVPGHEEEGLFTYDVGDYVQDGLIAMYDGIRNKSRTEAHDNTFQGWNNLATNSSGVAVGPHLTFVLAQEGGDIGCWTNGNAYAFNLASYAQMNEALVSEGDCLELTIEAAVFVNRTASTSRYTYISEAADSYGISTKKNDTERLTWFSNGFSISNTGLGGETWWTGSDVVLGGYFSYIQTADQMCFSGKNTTNYLSRLTDRQVTSSWSGRTWVIGGSKGCCSKSTFHSVRFYNRTLSEAELGRNYTIDGYRFRGVAAPTNVIVATSVPGVEATEPTGGYLVSGEYTFTIPAQTNVNNNVYKSNGYVLEVLDSASDDLKVVVTNLAVTSFTYTNCLARSRVRLTWLWEKEGSLRKAGDYDVDDYVQDGLVAHYDGIRNAGQDYPLHDSTLTVWTNLVENGPHLQFVKKDGDTGGWSPSGNAYDFVGSSYAQMTGPLTLKGATSGQELTVELVLDIDLTTQGTTSRTYLTHTPTQSTVGRTCAHMVTGYNYGNPRGRSIAWFLPFAKNNGAGAPNNWDGKYVAGLVTTEDVIVYYNSNSSSSIARNTTNSGSGKTWSIGGSAFGYSIGSYYAVRFYERALKETELEWNQKVDAIRFRGELAPTNVIVTTTFEGVEGNEPNGAYEVDGKWTFTANEKVTLPDGSKVQLTGYKLYEATENGGWSLIESKNDLTDGKLTYTYEASESAKTVQLKWCFGVQGFKVIVR